MRSRWRGLGDFIRNDSMSIALFGLFLLCLAGQAGSGFSSYNAALREGHMPAVAFSAYLHTGNFLDGLFSNWQAAILQLAVLIAFGSVLRQRGAAHSRKPARKNHRILKWKFMPRKTLRGWFYANSLSLAFLGMFIVTFMLHALFGHWKYNEDQALRHLPPAPLGAYAGSAGFWFSVFQCWEAEFGAIGIYILASIFLRQEHSPESKPPAAQDRQTGGTNE